MKNTDPLEKSRGFFLCEKLKYYEVIIITSCRQSPYPFEDCDALLQHLIIKSKNYPLINKLYIPIIQRHRERYATNDVLKIDCNDWLMIPYFQCLWQNEYGRLNDIEAELSIVHTSLGEAKFDVLCQDLLQGYVLHKTIEGVHNKLLDFWAELRGMIHFIKSGHKISKIVRGKGKSPDFSAEKNGFKSIVECKYAHQSNHIRIFIVRYIRYLNNFQGWVRSPFDISPCFSYSGLPPKDLRQEDIEVLKNFIQNIIIENQTRQEVKLIYDQHEITVKFDEKNLCRNGSNIELLREMVGCRLVHLVYEKIAHRIRGAQGQLLNYTFQGSKVYVYIFLEIDQEYNIPFEEVDDIKKEVIENFEKCYGENPKVIIDTFPPVGIVSYLSE